jgi:hypothetical protein
MATLHETRQPRQCDSRDLVIEELADHEQALLERIASLEADVVCYRELAQAALGALRDRTKDCDQRSKQLSSLRAAYRDFRARMVVGNAQVAA